MKKAIKFLALITGTLCISNLNVNALEINTNEIDNSTYIIGKHMFTRENSINYSGVLTTDLIMLASKTIESNNLEDMIIYYKNARGVWVDALKNKPITIPEKIDLDMKNNEIFMPKPTISSAAGNGPIDGSWGENQSALLDVAYSGPYKDNDSLITGIELYEKINDKYELIKDVNGTTVDVEAKLGERKVYVVKVYNIDRDNRKVYSDYSDEFVLDNSYLVEPTIQLIPKDSGLSITNGNIVEGGYGLDYSFELSINNSPYDTKRVDGYDVYEKIDGQYKLIMQNDNSNPTNITVRFGEKRIFKTKVYVLDEENNKIYSNFSKESYIDNTYLIAPSPYSGSGGINEDQSISVDISIGFLDNYSKGKSAINGYELYEIINNNYKLVEDNKETLSSKVSVSKNEMKTYTMRVYKTDNNGKKIYSDYSKTTITVNNGVLAAPTLESRASGELTISFQGAYQSGTGGNYKGYELYEKVNDSYILLDTKEDKIFNYTTTFEKGKIFVIRVYNYDENNEKVYSDYSNEYIITEKDL